MKPEVAAAAAIFDDEGRILLVLEREEWSFPGGRLEPGETPEQAVVREAREEAAIEVAVDEHVGAFRYDDGFVLHVFLCTIPAGEPKAPPDVVDLGWFDPASLPQPAARALGTLPAVLARRESRRSESP